MNRITTAVIPVAGSGSRIRPLSLAMPKEMLATPFGPIIELITNELIDAGIERIIYVTTPGKGLIQQHLNAVTLHKHPDDKKVSLEFINQSSLPGSGGAILTAVTEKSLTDPFVVVWGDEIFIEQGSVGRTGELIEAYSKINKPCILLTEINEQDIHKCGMAITRKSESGENLHRIINLVEKPEHWPHDKKYASVGGYILDLKTIEFLRQVELSDDGELYLSKALSNYLQSGEDLYGVLTTCEWHETGSMDGYISAFESLAALRRQGILK